MDIIKIVKSDNIIGGKSTMTADFSKLLLPVQGVPPEESEKLPTNLRDVANWTQDKGTQTDNPAHFYPLTVNYADLPKASNLVRNGDFSLHTHYWSTNSVTISEYKGKMALVINELENTTPKYFFQELDIGKVMERGYITIAADVYVDSTNPLIEGGEPTLDIAVTTVSGTTYPGGVVLQSLPYDIWTRVTAEVTLDGYQLEEIASIRLQVGYRQAAFAITNFSATTGDYTQGEYAHNVLDLIAADNLFNRDEFGEVSVSTTIDGKDGYEYLMTVVPNKEYTITTTHSAGMEPALFVTRGDTAINLTSDGVLPYGKPKTITSDSEGKIKIFLTRATPSSVVEGLPIKIVEGREPALYTYQGEQMPRGDCKLIELRGGATTPLYVEIPVEEGIYEATLTAKKFSGTLLSVGDSQNPSYQLLNELQDTSYYQEYALTEAGTIRIGISYQEVTGATTSSLVVKNPSIRFTGGEPTLEEIKYTVALPAAARTLVIEGVIINQGFVRIDVGNYSKTFSSSTTFTQVTIPEQEITEIKISYSSATRAIIGAVKLFKGEDVQEVVNITPLYLKEIRRSNLEGWYVEGEFDIEDAEHLQQDYLLMVPTKTKKLQPFRIHNREIDNDVVKIYARHIVYDLANYIVPSQNFVDYLPISIVDQVTKFMLPTDSPFRINVSAGTPTSIEFKTTTLLEVLTLLQKSGGYKIDIDGFNINIAGNLGKTTDIALMWGSNIEGVRITENFDNVTTTMYPILSNGYVAPPVHSPIQYGKPYVKTREFDLEIPEDKVDDNEWINEQLKTRAEASIERLQLPSISYVVTSSVPQELELYDTVRVYHPAITSVYGNTEHKELFFPIVVAAYEYNVISELVESLQYGTEMYNTYSILNLGTQEQIEALEERTDEQIDTMQLMIDRQTSYIDSKNQNGYIVINDNEIFAVDRLPKEDAVNVMRIGVGGIGMSNSGINGPFDTAWSLEHGFNADYIRVGTLDADRIAAGSITVDHVSSSFGRDLDFQSNESINFIVGGAVRPLQEVIDSQESTLADVNDKIITLQEELNNVGDNSELVGRIELIEQDFTGHDQAINILEQYKAQSEGILRGMILDEDGLSIFKVNEDGTPSEYRVVISETALEFKRGSDTIAYVSGEALYIEHAIIKSSIVIGSHFIESGSITPGRTIFRQAELA